MQDDKPKTNSLAAETARIRAEQRALEARMRQLEAAQDMVRMAVGTGPQAADLVPDLTSAITRLRSETKELEARANQLEAADKLVQEVLGSGGGVASAIERATTPAPTSVDEVPTVTPPRRHRHKKTKPSAEDVSGLLGYIRTIANSANNLAVGERKLLGLIGRGLSVSEAIYEMDASPAFVNNLRSTLVDKLLAMGAKAIADHVNEWFSSDKGETRWELSISPAFDAGVIADAVVQALSDRSMDATSVARSVHAPLEIVQRSLDTLTRDGRVFRFRDGAYTAVFRDVDNDTLNRIMVRLMTERPISKQELTSVLLFSKDPPYRGKKVENHHRTIRQHEPVQVARDAYGKRLWFIVPGQKPPPGMDGTIRIRQRNKAKAPGASAGQALKPKRPNRPGRRTLSKKST